VVWRRQVVGARVMCASGVVQPWRGSGTRNVPHGCRNICVVEEVLRAQSAPSLFQLRQAQQRLMLLGNAAPRVVTAQQCAYADVRYAAVRRVLCVVA